MRQHIEVIKKEGMLSILLEDGNDKNGRILRWEWRDIIGSKTDVCIEYDEYI